MPTINEVDTEHIGGLLLCNLYITMIFRLASGKPSGRQRQIAVIILGTWFDRAEQWLTCLAFIYLVCIDGVYAAKIGSAICGLHMDEEGGIAPSAEDRMDTHSADTGGFF